MYICRCVSVYLSIDRYIFYHIELNKLNDLCVVCLLSHPIQINTQERQAIQKVFLFLFLSFVVVVVAFQKDDDCWSISSSSFEYVCYDFCYETFNHIHSFLVNA